MNYIFDLQEGNCSCLSRNVVLLHETGKAKMPAFASASSSSTSPLQPRADTFSVAVGVSSLIDVDSRVSSFRNYCSRNEASVENVAIARGIGNGEASTTSPQKHGTKSQASRIRRNW